MANRTADGRDFEALQFGTLPHEVVKKNGETYCVEVEPEVDAIGDVNP